MEWKILPDSDFIWVREDGVIWRDSYSYITRDGKKYTIRSFYPKICIGNNGYAQFRAGNKLYLVHRCVARCFVEGETKDKCHVNHKDMNRINNHYLNLEWVTPAENNTHAHLNGDYDYSSYNHRRGNDNHRSKIPEAIIDWIINEFDKQNDLTQAELARSLGVSSTAIYNIRKGLTWKHKKGGE